MTKKTIKPEAQKGLADDREIDVIVICAVRYALTNPYISLETEHALLSARDKVITALQQK